MDSTRYKAYGFNFEHYRSSRLYREWTKCLSDYGILWRDETGELDSEPHLYLEELKLEFYLRPSGAAQSDSEIPWCNVNPLNVRDYWGDGNGNFGPSGLLDSIGHLYWCPDCQKSFLVARYLGECRLCQKQNAWLIEIERLTWFGYAGPVHFRPTEITLPLRGPSLRELAEAHRQAERLALESLASQAVAAEPTSDLFDPAHLQQAENREKGQWDALKTALSGKARVHQWPAVEAIDSLALQYPNFADVCDLVRTQVMLGAYRKLSALRLPNLLFVGGPSCGKSSFSRKLAQILVGDDWNRIDFGQALTSFELTGTDSGFTRSKEGRILRALISKSPTGPVRNPVLVLDELDKVGDDSHYPPLPAMLSLLDKHDAQAFRDAFFGVPVDASGIQYLATANDQYAIPKALLSRFEVFSIQDYSEAQFLDVVVPTIYREWTATFHDGTFPEELSRPTRQLVAHASEFTPRRVEAALQTLCAQGVRELQPRVSWDSLGLTGHQADGSAL